MNDIMREVVIARLAALGWAIDDPLVAVGQKVFETAVADKQALVYLSGGDEYNRTLSGQYESEGRNVVSSFLIPLTVDVPMIEKIVDQFVVQAVKSIDQSYARRLFLKYPKTK